MKQVVFNVGGALSTYVEFDDKKLLIDVGKNDEFNPIIDFLLPLYRKRGNEKSQWNDKKYHIDQLIISHPHKDHLSSIVDFDKYFHSELLTCPNSNDGMQELDKINWELIGNKDDPSIIKLKEMLVGRQPPLRTTADQNEWIYYLPPKTVENNKELSAESYCNNISIAVFLLINNRRIFLPGDIQKAGMVELLNIKYALKSRLRGGVDVLVAPHHGLTSSFSVELFDLIPNHRTQCLNIVSEKTNNPDENRTVDSRYSSSEYCYGRNNLKCNQFKTSNGHLFIDYSPRDYPSFEVITDNSVLVDKFL
jgi:beta-lactamase superfamily II metal-dependent hydrolase